MNDFFTGGERPLLVGGPGPLAHLPPLNPALAAAIRYVLVHASRRPYFKVLWIIRFESFRTPHRKDNRNHALIKILPCGPHIFRRLLSGL